MIFTHYLPYLTFPIAGIIFLFVILSYRNKPVVKNKLPTQSPPAAPSYVITSHDIRAIAGDDVIATQLDLARAYIEIGKKVLAGKILDHVIKQGTSRHQEEARQLLKNLKEHP